MRYAFNLGDYVQPNKKWRDTGLQIPTGRVRARQPFGWNGVFRVQGCRTFWNSYCLEQTEPTMRLIATHKASDLNTGIEVGTADERGPGNAHHDYRIEYPHGENDRRVLAIHFQKGALREAGPNGISDEALLAVLIDRLQGFQAGPFSCRENAIALTKMEEAMHWLQHRTRDRLNRGVEGKSEK